MKTRSRILASLTALGMTLTGLSLHAQAADAPAAGSANVNALPDLGLIAPPSSTDADAPMHTASVVLAPVRANVSMTTNALLGFVNSQPVFVQDMLRPIDGQLRSLAANAHSITDFREAARDAIQRQMRNYVSQIVVNSAATAALTDEDKGRLDAYIGIKRSELLSKYGGSQALADEALKPLGSSVDKEIADARRDMTMKLYMHKQLYPKIVVTRQMVLNEYERSSTKQQDAEIEMFTITLPITRWLREPSTDGKKGPVIAHPTPEQLRQAEKQAMATAQEITEKVRKGADFAELVEDYQSRDDQAHYGGRMKIKRGSLTNAALENYAFSLPANSVGDPFLLKNDDFHKTTVVVIKIGQKKEARTIPFSEAQQGIIKSLSEQQYNTLAAQYMQKLSQGASIEAVERMTDVALDVAVSRYATQ